MNSLGTVLAVWAHPDDEAYLSAGLLSLATQDGRRAAVVTATRGEAGSWDENRWPPSDMGRLRTQEMEASLAVLGVTEHHWLEYVDATCEAVDDSEGTAKVAAIIAEVQPDTVLTFGPDGQTGHPDHLAVHRWTTAAFEQAAPSGAQLHYSVIVAGPIEERIPWLRAINVFDANSPIVAPANKLSINLTLTPDLMELKMKALEAHASQFGPLVANHPQLADLMIEFNQQESFVLAATKP
ncbi:MAG TPA: PIG-L family deacetylase [Actinomycetota bacterium]|nr:PIG-L family deacetylase [Actinomycetota bacterium]